MRRARLNWPPISSAASNSVTAWPRSAAVVAAARPAGPGADDGDRASSAARRRDVSSVSWHAYGLTRHVAISRAKMWSRHAWLQPMQVLISSARPAAALRTNSGSARNGRAIDTMSASPRASTASPVAGSLMRLVVISGMPHLALHPPRDPRERGARHHRRDRRDARLVPADAGVDDRRARRLDRLGERDDLVPRAAAFDEVEHRQAIDDDEVACRPLRACGARSRPGSGCGSRTRRPIRRRDGWSAARRTG